MDITVFIIKNGCCGVLNLQFCLRIAVKNNERGCITSKRDAVDLQKCLPIAVKENNHDQLFFISKKDAVRGVQCFFSNILVALKSSNLFSYKKKNFLSKEFIAQAGNQLKISVYSNLYG